jgi:hypothetical protein
LKTVKKVAGKEEEDQKVELTELHAVATANDGRITTRRGAEECSK